MCVFVWNLRSMYLLKLVNAAESENFDEFGYWVSRCIGAIWSLISRMRWQCQFKLGINSGKNVGVIWYLMQWDCTATVNNIKYWIFSLNEFWQLLEFCMCYSQFMLTVWQYGNEENACIIKALLYYFWWKICIHCKCYGKMCVTPFAWNIPLVLWCTRCLDERAPGDVGWGVDGVTLGRVACSALGLFLCSRLDNRISIIKLRGKTECLVKLLLFQSDMTAVCMFAEMLIFTSAQHDTCVPKTANGSNPIQHELSILLYFYVSVYFINEIKVLRCWDESKMIDWGYASLLIPPLRNVIKIKILNLLWVTSPPT